MLCNKKWKKSVTMMVLALGVVSFLFGLLAFLIIKPDGHAINTLLGMFTGFGFGIMLVAIYQFIRSRVVSKEKLQQEEIDREDERNVTIGRMAAQVGFYVAFGLFGVLTFVFMGLGYRVPSYVCLGAIYVLAGAVLIARKVLEKRM